MHMPDGVLDPTALVATGAVAAGALAWSFRELRRGRPRTGLALGGVAGLIVAHLADVPLYGPYTAHLIGGTLLAIAIGPPLALVSMAAALAIEAVMWHDGGTAALGANVLVMGVVGVLVGYWAYRGALALSTRLRGDNEDPHAWFRASAAAIGAWLSVMASALTLRLLVATSGGAATASAVDSTGGTLGELLLSYAGWGLLEASITGTVVAFGAAWSRSVARIEVAEQIARCGLVPSG